MNSLPYGIEPPTLQEINDAIHRLQEVDLKSVAIDELKDSLFIIFKGYMNQTPQLKPGQLIYRGVSWDERPNNVSQLSYPPSEVIGVFGRVNRPGKSIFYGCTSMQAIFYELGLESKDQVAVGKWRMKSPFLLNNIGYTSKSFDELQSNRAVPDWSVIKEPPKGSNALRKEFLSREFTRRVQKGEEHLYKLSIAVAEKHLHGEMFAGLLYPSVARQANADNMALKPDYVDRGMCLEEVQYIQVNKHQNELEYDIAVLDSANEFTDTGEILWKGPPKKWILDKEGAGLLFRVESGKWVARNKAGEVVEPF